MDATQDLCGLNDSRYIGRVMTKMCFFPEKEDVRNFAYVLEFMLTFDKMQNTSPLMCIKFEI